MIEKLPYTLTKGVTATREGLEIEDMKLTMFIVDEHDDNDLEYAIPGGEVGVRLYRIPWPDAAERLRYREGENWAQLMNNHIVIEPGKYNPFSDLPVLHRLAAILCDDAEAFRVLHWCVTSMLQEIKDELPSNDHLDTSGG